MPFQAGVTGAAMSGVVASEGGPRSHTSIPVLHAGSHFRHGLLQLMIHTIDPLHDGKFENICSNFHLCSLQFNCFIRMFILITIYPHKTWLKRNAIVIKIHLLRWILFCVRNDPKFSFYCHVQKEWYGWCCQFIVIFLLWR